ncbi:hypothetical protein ABW19_dt0208086 [Dactylella cylindrospora]|nr:hypothetical protein ABW19_dt0208086 [Dactylella cylindrospora]
MYKNYLEPQTKLKTLRLNFRSSYRWQAGLQRLLGLPYSIKKQYNWDGWAGQLEPFLDLAGNLTRLSAGYIDNDTSLVNFIGLLLAYGKSLRFVDVNMIFNPKRDPSPPHNDILEQIIIHFAQKGLNLRRYAFHQLDLQELSLRGFLRRSSLGSSIANVTSLINLQRLRKLNFDFHSGYTDLLANTLPLASRLSDLRISYVNAASEPIGKVIASITHGLRVLQILEQPGRRYIDQEALTPHQHTLEVLWLDNTIWGDRLKEEDDLEINWATISSGWFTRLREVAVPLPYSLFEDQRVISTAGSRIRFLRLLNLDRLAITVPVVPARKIAEATCRHIETSMEGVSRLEAMIFGSWGTTTTSGLEPDIYLLRPEEGDLDSTGARCLCMTATQAKYMYPELEILEFDRKECGWSCF